MRAALDRSVFVLGTGAYVPDRVITNAALRDLCTNYDEAHSGDFGTWVDRVTHIHERRFIADGQTAGEMGVEAARRALDMAGVPPTDLDLIILASFTPSTSVPGDHVVLADRLGAKATPNFTLTGACAGSVYGMAMAYGLLASGAMRRILIVGAETISPTLDFSDPLTAILFGDGAGAVLLGRGERSEGGMLPPFMGFEFNWENIQMGNANLPFSSRVRVPAKDGQPPALDKPYLVMVGGQSVLRNAVNNMAASVYRVLGYEGKAPPAEEFAEDLARMRLVPHQANGRIVDGLARKVGVDPVRVAKTLYRVGNISAASNLIALDFAMRRGNLAADFEPETGRILAIREVEDPIRPGELVVLPSIGAGYLFGATAFVHAG